MSALSKVEMSVSAPFGSSEAVFSALSMVVMSKRELNRLDGFGTGGQRQINGSVAAELMAITPRPNLSAVEKISRWWRSAVANQRRGSSLGTTAGCGSRSRDRSGAGALPDFGGRTFAAGDNFALLHRSAQYAVSYSSAKRALASHQKEDRHDSLSGSAVLAGGCFWGFRSAAPAIRA